MAATVTVFALMKGTIGRRLDLARLQGARQGCRGALVATRGITDTARNPVDAAPGFERFRHDLNFGQTCDPVLKAYRKELIDALKQVESAGIDVGQIAVASVFTTQSVTASLEKIHEQIANASIPDAASFDIPVELDSTATIRAVFDLSEFINLDANAITGQLQAVQQQAGQFLLSEGQTIIDPDAVLPFLQPRGSAGQSSTCPSI